MTRGSDLSTSLIQITDNIRRHLEESEKFGKDIAQDLEVFRERQRDALERYAKRMQQAYDAYWQEIHAISGGMINATNAKLMQTGIISAPDDVHQIADACKPDMSRIEAKREK